MNDTEAPFFDRFIAGASYGGFSVIGLTFNVTLLIILVRNRSTFPSNAFYIFVRHLMLGDMAILIAEVIVSMPLSLSGKALLGEGALRLALSSIDTVGFCIVAFTTFFLSLNRLSVFVAPRLNNMLFTKPVVYFIFAIPWVYALFWVSFTTLIGCPKTFSHESYYFFYNCSSDVTELGTQAFHILLIFHEFIPVVCLIFYGIIYVILHLNANNTTDEAIVAEQRKRERNFLIQALVICCSLELETLGFTYMPELAIAGFIDWYWVTLFIGWIIIINSSINPIILFTFNQSMREAFGRLIKRSDVVQLNPGVDMARSRSSQPVFLRISSIRNQSVQSTGMIVSSELVSAK